ncbi:unnamed protein product [Dimorphilus gyrociliatus]|uniref:Uncharacterized protein n=1 Tax=Dimorphilus gyrociliatus TaxID=2664684 RepID=A0A7I8VYU2_9ANNE|nr:unnamed protein product [Dimorphilus gyrociliatus]
MSVVIEFVKCPLGNFNEDDDKIWKSFLYIRNQTNEPYLQGIISLRGCNARKYFAFEMKVLLENFDARMKRTLCPNFIVLPYKESSLNMMYTKPTTITFGTTSITFQQKTTSESDRKGSCLIEDVADYSDIFKTIKEITKDNKSTEQKLVCHFIDFSRTGIEISREDLNKICIGYDEEKLINLTDKINRICFKIFFKEIPQWFLPEHENYNQPLAVAHARSMILIKLGVLRMKDVFAPNSKYGIFTGENLWRNWNKKSKSLIKYNKDKESKSCLVMAKMKKINKKYIKRVLNGKKDDKQQQIQDMEKVFGE